MPKPALVMVNAARGRETATRPTRYVFDEGHHVFDAADSTFAAALVLADTETALRMRRAVAFRGCVPPRAPGMRAATRAQCQGLAPYRH
mgnify:CR=1 FL=1